MKKKNAQSKYEINKKRADRSLRDPEEVLVPKSKKVRVMIFIIVHSILICLLPITAIFIPYPYGYICWFGFIIPIGMAFNIKAFHIHVEQYPSNSYADYKFVPKTDLLMQDGDSFIIEIERNDHIYTAYLKDKTLTFDMKGCLFPLTVIRAYFGRQFLMKCINKQKLIRTATGKNLNIRTIFAQYQNIKMIFKHKNKTRCFYLVKNYITKMNFLMKSINSHLYLPTYGGRFHAYRSTYVKATEQDFVDAKIRLS